MCQISTVLHLVYEDFLLSVQIIQKKRVDFWKKLHSWQKFYMTAGRNGRDKSQLWIPNSPEKPSLGTDSAMQHFMIEAVS